MRCCWENAPVLAVEFIYLFVYYQRQTPVLLGPGPALPAIEGLAYDMALERRILADYEARLARSDLVTLGGCCVKTLFIFC